MCSARSFWKSASSRRLGRSGTSLSRHQLQQIRNTASRRDTTSVTHTSETSQRRKASMKPHGRRQKTGFWFLIPCHGLDFLSSLFCLIAWDFIDALRFLRKQNRGARSVQRRSLDAVNGKDGWNGKEQGPPSFGCQRHAVEINAPTLKVYFCTPCSVPFCMWPHTQLVVRVLMFEWERWTEATLIDYECNEDIGKEGSLIRNMLQLDSLIDRSLAHQSDRPCSSVKRALFLKRIIETVHWPMSKFQRRIWDMLWSHLTVNWASSGNGFS